MINKNSEIEGKQNDKVLVDEHEIELDRKVHRVKCWIYYSLWGAAYVFDAVVWSIDVISEDSSWSVVSILLSLLACAMFFLPPLLLLWGYLWLLQRLRDKGTLTEKWHKRFRHIGYLFSLIVLFLVWLVCLAPSQSTIG